MNLERKKQKLLYKNRILYEILNAEKPTSLLYRMMNEMMLQMTFQYLLVRLTLLLLKRK